MTLCVPLARCLRSSAYRLKLGEILFVCFYRSIFLEKKQTKNPKAYGIKDTLPT